MEVIMKKLRASLFLTTIVLLAGGISALAFSGPQTEMSAPQRAKIELAQLRILDDPTIDNRIAEAQRKIDVGKQRGQLTPDEANRLQTYLNAVKERVAKYRRDGFLTGDERTKVNEMLTTLEERVRAERTDDEVAQRDAVDRRVAELQRRIDAGVRAGQLTRDEATQLQARLNRITEKAARYRADGRLTNDETSSLNQMLNTLEERIRYERNDTDTVHREAFEKRIAEIKRKIEAGMRAGQITLEEAWHLQTILNRVRERDAQFRSDGVLTREERMRLNRMLTHLEEQVYEEKWDANVDNPVFR
jgi:septal ring factor EnvC (AmiA/AmiB activator)